MVNCLFCKINECDWSGVENWVDCHYYPDSEDHDEDELRNMREYEDEQAELFMAEERAMLAVRESMLRIENTGGSPHV